VIKYRGIYRVFLQQNPKTGEYTPNQDDTYLKCKNNVHIFRYNKDTLAVQFNSNKYRNNRLAEFTESGIDMKLFVSGNTESVYLFDEKDLVFVANILRPIIKGKDKNPKKRTRNITEEQRQKLRKNALKNLRKV
jgi:hypothetical protein